jgi:predicted DNA binding protein
VLLTPLGVDTVRPLISTALPDNGPIGIQVARRELVNISGISKTGNSADVEFVWRWASINRVGEALYDSGVHYRSTVGFRDYDDGWRVVEQSVPSNQPLDEALRNAQPAAP